MKTHFISSIRLTLITLVLFGVVYPLLITGIAKFTAPNRGSGEVLIEADTVFGFELIGQSFHSAKYFQGRPSAVGYNASATGGSNKGPSNPEYLSVVEDRIVDFLKNNPRVRRGDIPVDLVTASGGGLDPHISVQSAQVQLERIATVRGMSLAFLQSVVDQSTERPLLGLFGPARVNVLKANLALDRHARRW